MAIIPGMAARESLHVEDTRGHLVIGESAMERDVTVTEGSCNCKFHIILEMQLKG